jgi:hypothetical protein
MILTVYLRHIIATLKEQNKNNLQNKLRSHTMVTNINKNNYNPLQIKLIS